MDASMAGGGKTIGKIAPIDDASKRATDRSLKKLMRTNY
jgi:hypothetical protein